MVRIMARHRQVQAVLIYFSQVKAHCRATSQLTLAKDCLALENQGKEGSLTNGQYEAVIFYLFLAIIVSPSLALLGLAGL